MSEKEYRYVEKFLNILQVKCRNWFGHLFSALIVSARNKTVSTGFPFEGAQVFQPDSMISTALHHSHHGGEGGWKKPSESALVSFGAKKLDGAGMDGIKKERKKERKGKRAMKPRRKNGINSLSFFSVRNAASNKKEISNNNGKNIRNIPFSDLYCF